MTIDAHHHFWKYSPETHGWIDDNMSVLKQDFLAAELKPILQQNGIDGCVSVQASQTEAENDFLMSQAENNPFIKGIVGWVDLRSDSLFERLEYYKQFPIIKGFRHVLQDEPDPNFMLQEDFLRGIGMLSAFGFTYDILIFHHQLPYAEKLVAKFPNQPFVIDHIAKPSIKTQEYEAWELGMRKIAAYPNVYCKISGMVTEADWHNWKKEDFTKYLDVVVDCFGTDRLMYGSDWPVSLLAAQYEKQLAIVKDYFNQFDQETQQKIFGQNAINFYKL